MEDHVIPKVHAMSVAMKTWLVLDTSLWDYFIDHGLNYHSLVLFLQMIVNYPLMCN